MFLSCNLHDAEVWNNSATWRPLNALHCHFIIHVSWLRLRSAEAIWHAAGRSARFSASSCRSPTWPVILQSLQYYYVNADPMLSAASITGSMMHVFGTRCSSDINAKSSIISMSMWCLKGAEWTWLMPSTAFPLIDVLCPALKVGTSCEWAFSSGGVERGPQHPEAGAGFHMVSSCGFPACHDWQMQNHTERYTFHLGTQHHWQVQRDPSAWARAFGSQRGWGEDQITTWRWLTSNGMHWVLALFCPRHMTACGWWSLLQCGFHRSFPGAVIGWRAAGQLHCKKQRPSPFTSHHH